MISQLGDEDGVIFYLVDEAMFRRDASRPVTREIMLQGFGLTDALILVFLNIPDQIIDAFEDFFVRFLPVEIILPGMLGKKQRHSRSSLAVPFPASNSSMDSSKRLTFLGLCSR